MPEKPVEIQVLIPSVFTRFTEGNHTHVLRAGTVGQAIERLVQDYPELSAQLLDDRGRLLSYVQLFLNDNQVRDLADLSTPLTHQDELLLVPALAGG
ncbi:MAG: MoaD/ThiS family protein [Planctomycetaceae bacterium]